MNNKKKKSTLIDVRAIKDRKETERVRPNITRKALQGSSRNSNKIKHINAKISVS